MQKPNLEVSALKLTDRLMAKVRCPTCIPYSVFGWLSLDSTLTHQQYQNQLTRRKLPCEAGKKKQF